MIEGIARVEQGALCGRFSGLLCRLDPDGGDTWQLCLEFGKQPVGISLPYPFCHESGGRLQAYGSGVAGDKLYGLQPTVKKNKTRRALQVGADLQPCI